MLSGRDLSLLPTFAAVVRRGSFTAAARELHLTKSVVSDHIRALEKSLSVRLLERTTRRLRLTQVGEQVMVAATAVLDAAGAISTAVERNQQRPTGTLRVTAPADLAVDVVVPVLAELAAAHAELRFEVISSDAPQDLVADGIDVALRLGLVQQPGAVVRQLASEPEVIVAAGALAEAYAAASRPSQLAELPWLGHSRLDFGATWKFTTAAGARDAVAVVPRALADSTDGLRALMLGGVGAAVLPLHAVRADLDAGRARRLCPEWFHRRLVLYAVMPTRKPPARARAFLKALAPALASHGFGVE